MLDFDELKWGWVPDFLLFHFWAAFFAAKTINIVKAMLQNSLNTMFLLNPCLTCQAGNDFVG